MEHDRRTAFAERLRTRIWQELPDQDNPWLATGAQCHGFSHSAMIEHLDYPQTLFLLLRGELPSARQAELLRRFLVAFCNPGPRHGATRATMSAAASGTQTRHLGAIGLALLGGDHLGSGEVESAAAFLARHRDTVDAEALARSLSTEMAGDQAGDRRIAPGFGTLYGAIDPYARDLAALLHSGADDRPTLGWGERFAASLHPTGCGWLMPGVAAAVCVDLGFAPRTAGALFQIAALPGLLAHGLEMSRQGLQAIPFVSDENYEMRGEALATRAGVDAP
jgi:citrate synthase